jgi:hypothetical protein
MDKSTLTSHKIHKSTYLTFMRSWVHLPLVRPLWPLPKTQVEPIVAHQVNWKAEVVAKHTGFCIPKYRKCVTWLQKTSVIGLFHSNLNSDTTNNTIIRELLSSWESQGIGRLIKLDSHDPFTLLHLTLSATTCHTSFILHCTLGSRWIQLTVWFEHLNLAYKPFNLWPLG